MLDGDFKRLFILSIGLRSCCNENSSFRISNLLSAHSGTLYVFACFAVGAQKASSLYHCRDPSFLEFRLFSEILEMEATVMKFNQDSFGSRLKMLRKELKMTQEQLAAELNIGADHLGKIEVGNRGISIDLLLDLSEKLNVSINFLIKGNEDRSPQAQILISKMRELLDQLEDIERHQS